MTSKNNTTWLDEQKALLTRNLERIRDDVIKNMKHECKRREESYQEELMNRDEKERVLLCGYNDELAKNSHLVDEISRLKQQLKKRNQRESTPGANATDTNKSAVLDPASTESGATIPIQEYRHLAEKFEELNKKYHDAIQQLKYLERKNAAVMQKNRGMKESVLAWQKYADRHTAKTAAAARKSKNTPEPPKTKLEHSLVDPSSSPRSALSKTPGPVASISTTSLAPPDLPPLASPSVVGGLAGQRQLHAEYGEDGGDGANNTKKKGLKHPKDHATYSGAVDASMFFAENEETADQLSSSQTEVGEATQARRLMPPPHLTDDDEEPEVVSTRSLKRKRHIRTTTPLHGPQVSGTLSEPVTIKEEPRSRPPAQVTPALVRVETLDLDNLGANVIMTPHGRRARREHAAKVATLRNERSMSVPLIKEEVIAARDRGASAGAVPEPTCTSAQKLSLSTPMGKHSARSRTSTEPKIKAEPTEDRHHGVHPLMEMDANARMPLHAEPTPSKRPSNRGASFSEKFQMLTESGEEPPPFDNTRKRLSPAQARESFNKRIKANKENMHTPSKPPPSTPKTAPSRLTTGTHYETPTAGTSKRPFAPSLCRQTPQTEPRMLLPTTKPSVQKQPQATLRQKPIADLRLSDFKPNPAYNQGYTYAFSETVRRRADRACLPGCTRPSCCGSTFRVIASTLPPLAPSQSHKLLKDFLGDAYHGLEFSQMSEEEKGELVLQARTKEVADRHGKHRHAYERPRSPPGYWRVEFPTTQEEAEDRRLADEMEREEVQVRRAEALRKGGRWVFRDELESSGVR